MKLPVKVLLTTLVIIFLLLVSDIILHFLNDFSRKFLGSLSLFISLFIIVLLSKNKK